MNHLVTLFFKRVHTKGILKGIQTRDQITHVDRKHAAHWVRGIRRNSRLGRLDYYIKNVVVL